MDVNDKVSGFSVHGNVTDVSFNNYNKYRIVNIVIIMKFPIHLDISGFMNS